MAIRSFDATRARVLSTAGALAARATSLDAADEAATAGDARPAARLRGSRGPERSSGLLAVQTRNLAEYRRAASRLQSAASQAPGLDESQRTAVQEVVRSAAADVAANQRFRSAAALAWPSYEQLVHLQAEWLGHVSAGWYRDDREAGDAIVSNFALHWFPAKVFKPSLDWTYSFWLGTISAALFLREFIGDYPWVHLDIAGTAYSESDLVVLPKGPTGIPVGTFLEFVRGRAG